MAVFQQPPRESRRRFLAALIFITASLLFLGKFLRPRTPRRQRLLSVPKSDIPARGALVYREARVAVMREGEDIYALSLSCTHLGCTVSVTPGEITCPCHGSVFDRRGRVVKGPAERPLLRYTVEERNGTIVVMM